MLTGCNCGVHAAHFYYDNENGSRVFDRRACLPFACACGKAARYGTGAPGYERWYCTDCYLVERAFKS